MMDYSEINKIIEEHVGKLKARGSYGEAINYLTRMKEEYPDNDEIDKLLDQLRKITEYLNRDIFGDTNLDMDPWF